MTDQERAMNLYQEIMTKAAGGLIEPFNMVYDDIYLGGQPNDNLAYPQVDAVLNLQAENYRTLVAKAILWMPIHDAPPFPGLDWLETAVLFIEKCQENG